MKVKETGIFYYYYKELLEGEIKENKIYYKI